MERGMVVWITSASAAAASEVAAGVAEALAGRDLTVELLHAERAGFERLSDPGALATVAGLLAAHGVTSVVAEAVASRTQRDAARRGLGSMIEVLVTSGAAAAGAWEAPPQAEVEVDAAEGASGVSRVLRTLEVLGYLKPRKDLAYSSEEEQEVIKRLKAFGYM
jgi:hypothetical protein